MRIIGHRGAAGLELENTLASLQKAKDLGVDGVEFDVHLTRDRHLVLSHDSDLSRVSDSTVKIADQTLKQLKGIILHNGERIPTLDEALTLLGDLPVIIESKVSDADTELLEAVDAFPEAHITVASFHHALIARLQELRPQLRVYLAEHFQPVEIINLVRRAQADGFDMNVWLLNPYTYWMAQRRNLDVMVYTVNSRFIVWFIKRLYPNTMICTDHPERFIKSGKAKG